MIPILLSEQLREISKNGGSTKKTNVFHKQKNIVVPQMKTLKTTTGTSERSDSFFSLHTFLLSDDFSVLLHELSEIDLGGLEHLHLTDHGVLERVDVVALLLDSSTNSLSGELGHKRSQIALGDFFSDDGAHLSTNSVDLRVLSVAGLLVLVSLLAGETDAEHTELVTVGGVDFNIALNESLPLLDHRAELITSDVHTVEESDALITLNIFHTQSHLAVALFLVGVEITEISFKDTTLQTFRSNLETRSTGDKSLADIALLELIRGTNVVPLLLSHGINNLLTLTLLADLLLGFAYIAVRNKEI